VRELLASLGMRSLDEAIGRTDLLRQRRTNSPGADMLDLSQILVGADFLEGKEIRHMGVKNELPAGETLNDRLLADAQPALEGAGPVQLSYTIRNCERTFGARLAGVVGKMFGMAGLPDQSVQVQLRGSAGQSFGAFNPPGVHFTLVGEANDYVGKGMAGGTIAIRPGDGCTYDWSENVIAGNTILYGATGGTLYMAGRAGERFAVRNSGATAVVEGLGDHGCEYMTGGTVLVLGPVGYNFGAGMTGGVAYLLDPDDALPIRCNRELVRIDPLSAEEEQTVQALLQQHVAQTSSPLARTILNNWATYREQFRRVMPKEAVAKIEAANEGAEDKGKTTKKETVPA
jgi:glutamate synthase (ferredoxin)